MADGTLTPIDELRPGDLVTATDPETGETAAEPVEAVWVHTDDLYTLGINGEQITTTENHPFWSVTDQRFEPASDLALFELVATSTGTAPVTSTIKPAGTNTAYNLTITRIHTYRIGQQATLVHNTCPVLRSGPQNSWDVLHDPAALEGLTPSQVDDLARNAGYEVLPGKAGGSNPATRYREPGTGGREGFHVMPEGVQYQPGVKGSPYLRFDGRWKADEIRVPLSPEHP